MKIIKDFKNELLKRREMRVILEDNSNPGFEKVRNIIVEKLKIPIEVLIVYSIKSNFGSKEFFVDFSIYDSTRDKEKIEPKKKEKKTKGESK